MEKNLIPRPEHPQPMFKRENWQNLNGEWLFQVDLGIGPKEDSFIEPFNSSPYSQKIIVPLLAG